MLLTYRYTSLFHGTGTLPYSMVSVPVTGLCVHKGHASGLAKDPHMRILGAPPTKVNLEKALNKKVKSWLGIG